MATKIVISGYFAVSSSKVSPEYGCQVGLVEMGETYPQTFNLALPSGHVWEKGEQMKLEAVTQPRTVTARQGVHVGNKFLTYDVKSYSKTVVHLRFEEEDGKKKP